ncbi:rRNA-processing protein utp21 [Massospora cicadina]|nr:rRNA-processing protein utp21 [Massospora cicadina]
MEIDTNPITEVTGPETCPTHRTAKRTKAHAKVGPSTTASKIFHPIKAVGYVCNHVPFSLQMLGQAAFYTTSIGHRFQVFENDKLGVVMVGCVLGRPVETPINAITTRRESTFVAAGNKIFKFHRNEQVSAWTSPLPGDIFHLEVFGNHLLSLTEDNVFQLWNFETGELYTDIQFHPESFNVTCVVHPATYLNKVVFGSTQGAMQLWNIKTRKLIYTFKPFASPITCLVQSPVVDVLGIGLLDGTLLLYNVKLDKLLISFKQVGKVSAITFRSDEQHHMASASMNGDIAIWDLDSRKLFHVIKRAHTGNIPSIQYLNHQNLLVSSGADNSLKQWIFDGHDHMPRLFKSRGGHSAPPTQIRYYHGGNLMSASQDCTLRQFSCFKDNRSKEFSQGKLGKMAREYDVEVASLRLPPITQLAVHNAQQKRFDNLLTVHLGQAGVCTWSVLRGAIGSHLLTPPGTALPKAVAISQCGHFGFVGTAAGEVHLFNLQSGILRKSTPSHRAHQRPVSAILPDGANRRFTTASIDGTLKVWDFSSFDLVSTIQLDSPVFHAVAHPDTCLVAAACDDGTVRVVDTETLRVVRHFSGHSHRLTDLAFSVDGRWIVSSSLDATIRTWDVPSGHPIDVFRVDSVVTSLHFSPFGDFLATTHADHVGIFLWSNKAFYADISFHALSPTHLPQVAPLPASRPDEAGDEEAEECEPAPETPDQDLYQDADQITSEMVTLSRAPWSKWQKLLNLATIKQRNKPIAPPKKPAKVPFFLATTQGVNPKFVAPKPVTSETAAEEEPSHVLSLGDAIESELLATMGQALRTQDTSRLLEAMEGLAPPQIELEVSLLSPRCAFAQFHTFLEALALLLEAGVGFEMAHAYLHVFLKAHGDLIAANPGAFERPLGRLLAAHAPRWGRLSNLFHSTAALMDFVRSK